MKYYWRDTDAFAAGTLELTLEECGAYDRLLDALYNRDGDLPDDIGFICRVLRCDPRVAKRLRDRLVMLGKFQSTGVLLSNLRATYELSRAQVRSTLARSRAEKRWKNNGRDDAKRQCKIEVEEEVVKKEAITNTREKGLICANGSAFAHEFQQFWSAYPRKLGKQAAHQALIKALKRVSLETIIAAIERQKPGWSDPQYIPHPASWLNGARWEDEPPKLAIVQQRVII